MPLGVAHVLEGSVRRIDNRVVVNVQLIDARTDRPIWAERYDRTIADSLGLQGELATEIAKALKAKLAPEEKASLGTKPTSNPEAYVAYLRALDFEENAEIGIPQRRLRHARSTLRAGDRTGSRRLLWRGPGHRSVSATNSFRRMTRR